MTLFRISGLLLLVVGALSEEPQEYSSDDEYSSIAYSAPQPLAKAAPYAANVAPYPAKAAPYPAKSYGPPSYSYGTPAPYYGTPAPYYGTPAPAVPPAPAPGTGAGTGPGPSASGPGPSGPGPSGPGPSALGPSGPGPFGGPGPWGGPFGPGPFLPYAYGGPLGFKLGLKKGLLHYLIAKFKVGFQYLSYIVGPISTITTLMNTLNFLKIKVVPKFAHKLQELQIAQPHDVAEAVTAARRYKRSLQDLDSLTERVLSAIDKNMCTEKLVCQIGKKASQMVSVDSSWVTSTLTMLKKLESPNSLISTFRQSVSNVIPDCDVIICKNIQSSSDHDSSSPLHSNNLNDNKDSSKTLLDEDEGIEDGDNDSEYEETSQD